MCVPNCRTWNAVSWFYHKIVRFSFIFVCSGISYYGRRFTHWLLQLPCVCVFLLLFLLLSFVSLAPNHNAMMNMSDTIKTDWQIFIPRKERAAIKSWLRYAMPIYNIWQTDCERQCSLSYTCEWNESSGRDEGKRQQYDTRFERTHRTHHQRCFVRWVTARMCGGCDKNPAARADAYYAKCEIATTELSCSSDDSNEPCRTFTRCIWPLHESNSHSEQDLIDANCQDPPESRFSYKKEHIMRFVMLFTLNATHAHTAHTQAHTDMYLWGSMIRSRFALVLNKL